MYKKQIRLQRVLCILSIAASAIIFLYSLGIMTDLYDMLYTMIPNPDNPSTVKVDGAMIYYDMQGFNHSLLIVGIVLILLSVLLMVTNTHTRRRYYISNYVAIALNAAANLCAAVWAHGQIIAFKTQFLTTIDFDNLEKRLRRAGTFTTSTFWFDIHYAVFCFALLIAVLLVINAIWKTRLMKEEKSLLQAGKAVKA